MSLIVKKIKVNETSYINAGDCRMYILDHRALKYNNEKTGGK